MKKEFDQTEKAEEVFKMVGNIVLKAQETAEEFIFNTIYPFAQEQTQIVIDKKFLVDAIRKQTPMGVIPGEGMALDRCPACKTTVVVNFIHCPTCGQRLSRNVCKVRLD